MKYPKSPKKSTIIIKSSFGIDVRVTGRQVRRYPRGGHVAKRRLQFVNVDSDAYRRIVQLMFSGDQSWTGQEYPERRCPAIVLVTGDDILRACSGAQYE